MGIQSEFMKLSNPFSSETREFFRYEYSCWLCGSNQMLELHHITGRGKYSKYTSSIYNCALICHLCHSKMTHSEIEESKLLNLNQIFLKKRNYKAKTIDKNFYEETKSIRKRYSKWYMRILKHFNEPK